MTATEHIARLCQAKSAKETEVIQELWSGFGKISRFEVKGGQYHKVVVKQIAFPKVFHHPKGWNTKISHTRKVKSYEVEKNWYKNWSNCCDDSCRIPKHIGSFEVDNEVFIVLEDMDDAGFSIRKTECDWNDVVLCLKWLAGFHARFMNQPPNGLWEVGTYWHLDTRPDELDAMKDEQLKAVAPKLDHELSNARFQTLVHGDAKLANFCFSSDKQSLAGVDFQYVGGGCGMKDVAYFMSSCLSAEECDKYENEVLDIYFKELRKCKPNLLSLDLSELEKEWRSLYPIAWTDFYRFLNGWSPDHWKVGSYMKRMKEISIEMIS